MRQRSRKQSATAISDEAPCAAHGSSESAPIIAPDADIPDATTKRPKRNVRLSVLGKASGITALAFVLSFLISSPFSATISALFSSSEKSDFNMSDLFCQIADNRPVRSYEDRIAILDIGNLNRQEIAEILSLLVLCEPKCVAMDINFESRTENDSLLLRTLSSIPSLVLPLGVAQKGDKFEVSDRPFFYDSLPGVNYGIINFPSKYHGATVREYAQEFPMTNGSRKLSFPAMAARTAGFKLPATNAEPDEVPTGIIQYHSKEIPVISYEDLAERVEELHDRIVLVGTTSEAGDVYATPLRRGVSGLEIHAYALSTILDGAPLKRLPTYVVDIVAVVLCFLMVWGAIGITWGTKGLLLRLAQVGALYFLVWAGYAMLVDRNTVSDFSQAILMVTFGLFAVDLWNGTEAVVNWCKKKIKQKKKKTEEQTI